MEASILYEKSNPLPNLPLEIIVELLSRLPVKSLLKFRCVCKSWLSLISSPQFIKAHLNLSTTSNNYAKRTLILASCTVPFTFFTCSLSSVLSNTDSVNPIALDFPMIDPNYMLWVVGTCNGLLCVSDSPDTLILYNPTIKMFKKLPVSGTDMDTSSYITYGFCYDELNDDYKVVELNGLSNDVFGYKTEVKVYSLRNNSWRKIEDFPDGPVSCGAGISVGGALHWSAANGDGPWIILALDMVAYAYSTMALPNFDGRAEEVDWSLGESGGLLGMFCDYSDIRVDIWVMKEYGVEESWSKLASIPYSVVDPRRRLWPVFVSEDEEVFFNCEPYVILYNSRDNSFRNREIRSIKGPLLIVAPTYIESLVAPSLDG